MNTICGAKTRGTGKPCRRYPRQNGRCRLHGGLSSGPKTPEGITRIKEANTIHGCYSKEAVVERSLFQGLIRTLRS